MKVEKLRELIESDQNKILYILIGVPASGKSTFTNKIIDMYGKRNVAVCSTDDFFMVDGKYMFDASKLGQYHANNLNKAKKAIENNVPVVVIDNTNLSVQDFIKYVRAGINNEYTIKHKKFKVDREELIRRAEKRKKETGKEISVEVIDRMLNKYKSNEKKIDDFFKSLDINKKLPIYTGIFFDDDEIKEIVKKLGIRVDNFVKNMHITTSYPASGNPDNEYKECKIFKYLEDLDSGHKTFVCEILDKSVEFKGNIPHITIEVGEGKKPVFSNELIDDDTGRVFVKMIKPAITIQGKWKHFF